MSGPIRGSCLCGRVKFVIEGKYGPLGQCHCSRCRKASGTDGSAVFHASAAGFRWLSGQDAIRGYTVPNSGGWVASFCGECGSPAPFVDPRGRKVVFVPAGLLDDDPGFRGYAAHIFVESKAPWVVLTDAAPQFAEGFAKSDAAAPSTAR